MDKDHFIPALFVSTIVIVALIGTILGLNINNKENIAGAGSQQSLQLPVDQPRPVTVNANQCTADATCEMNTAKITQGNLKIENVSQESAVDTSRNLCIAQDGHVFVSDGDCQQHTRLLILKLNGETIGIKDFQYNLTINNSNVNVALLGGNSHTPSAIIRVVHDGDLEIETVQAGDDVNIAGVEIHVDGVVAFNDNGDWRMIAVIDIIHVN